MQELMQWFHVSLAAGSWSVLAIMFVVGVGLSINPCMGTMVPLVLGGSKQGGYSWSLLFVTGFSATFMILGMLAASLGKVLMLPEWFWTGFLSLLYLFVGLHFLEVKLPLKVSGFYVMERPGWVGHLVNKDGLNPAVLGAVFALAPSPCTMPVLMAVGAFAAATGKVLFTALALGAFGLGHSLLLALAFVPAVRKLFTMRHLTKKLRPVLGMFLVALVFYLLFGPSDLFDHSSMTIHQYEVLQ